MGPGEGHSTVSRVLASTDVALGCMEQVPMVPETPALKRRAEDKKLNIVLGHIQIQGQPWAVGETLTRRSC